MKLFPSQPLRNEAVSESTAPKPSRFRVNRSETKLFPSQPLRNEAVSESTAPTLWCFRVNRSEMRLPVREGHIWGASRARAQPMRVRDASVAAGDHEHRQYRDLGGSGAPKSGLERQRSPMPPATVISSAGATTRQAERGRRHRAQLRSAKVAIGGDGSA
jgi:hypothetical protein